MYSYIMYKLARNIDVYHGLHAFVHIYFPFSYVIVISLQVEETKGKMKMKMEIKKGEQHEKCSPE